MRSAQRSILGISFDGLAISGIVNEFMNLAAALREEDCRVLFDFGYDIMFTRTTALGDDCLPPWIETIRCVETYPKAYCPEVVAEARRLVTDGTPVSDVNVYDEICNALATLFVTTFSRENVALLVVENGTIPGNPIMTEAVHRAILEYGARRELGKFALWRDHDLMWSADPHLYGPYPYRGVRRPDRNPHIQYAVLTDWMKARMRAWAPGVDYHVIPNRFFQPNTQHRGAKPLRAAYGIPQDAHLFARCTRIIPQKSVQRDLLLLDQIQRRLAASSSTQKKAFLFVTGPTTENPEEFERLRALERSLSISGQVIWGDGLLPFNPLLTNDAMQATRFSVRDVLADADINSFLTTYDYEGFGNPPGESMCMGVPYISTTYELYHEVYGRKGAIAPLLPITATSSAEDPIPQDFVEWTLRVMTDDAYRAAIIRRNLEVCRRYFSLDALKTQMKEIFPEY